MAWTAVLLMTLMKRDGMAGTETKRERRRVARAVQPAGGEIPHQHFPAVAAPKNVLGEFEKIRLDQILL